MCGLRVGTGVLPLMCVFDPGEPLLTMAECLSPCKPFFRSVSSSPHAAAISPASIVHHHHQYIYVFRRKIFNTTVKWDKFQQRKDDTHT